MKNLEFFNVYNRSRKKSGVNNPICHFNEFIIQMMMMMMMKEEILTQNDFMEGVIIYFRQTQIKSMICLLGFLPLRFLSFSFFTTERYLTFKKAMEEGAKRTFL